MIADYNVTPDNIIQFLATRHDQNLVQTRDKTGIFIYPSQASCDLQKKDEKHCAYVDRSLIDLMHVWKYVWLVFSGSGNELS